MVRLTALVGKLLPVLLAAVVLGTLGYLSASSILIFSAHALLGAVGSTPNTPVGAFLRVVILCAVARGFLRYFEQLAGHHMAFKLLAVLRDKVFSVLRQLAPARLEQQDQGALISTITHDIELLEVFYAHTLAPAAIALIVSVVMVAYIGAQHILLGFVAALAYISVGVVLPMMNTRGRKRRGDAYKDSYGQANSFLLESLYGLPETLRYGRAQSRKAELERLSNDMESQQLALKRFEAKNAAWTDTAVLAFSGAVLFIGLLLYQNGTIAFSQALVATVAMMSAFGPVVALSSLSNDLTHTVAAGERVLTLLDTAPETPEVQTGLTAAYQGVRCEDVGFTYGSRRVLQNINLSIPKTGIIGICGESGSGKTTLLKLIMRFWDVRAGRILVSEDDIRRINTKSLREMEGYVTQETFLFEGTLLENIRLSRPDATISEVKKAAADAGIHDFICQLPKGYHTHLGELGDGLSAGERQRIGLARALLHGAPLLLLDEPTSNLDSLNEALILKSLNQAAGSRSLVLISHRESTLRAAQAIYGMKDGTLTTVTYS